MQRTWLSKGILLLKNCNSSRKVGRASNVSQKEFDHPVGGCNIHIVSALKNTFSQMDLSDLVNKA